MTELRIKFKELMNVRKVHLILIAALAIKSLGGTISLIKIPFILILFVLYLKLSNVIIDKLKVKKETRL